MHHAFDAAAPTYDTDFTYTSLALWLREMVRAYLPFQPGDHVLEIGCGTGEDALWMAQQGIYVRATDASPAMLAEAERKITAAGYADWVQFEHTDMNHVNKTDVMYRVPTTTDTVGTPYMASAVPPGETPSPLVGEGAGDEGKCNAIFSNFGVLNCAADRPALAAWLAERIAPGGKAVFVVMNPLCPWEIIWHLAHGQITTAFRRLKSGGMAHAGGGQSVQVWYPSPGTLRREFAPYFRHEKTVGIGSLLPPSYLGHLVDRYPKTFARLAWWDRWIGRYFPFTMLNDHYLMVLERR